MKLPRVVRKFRKFSIYVSVYIMLTIFMFTPVAQVYSSYILPRDNYNSIRIGDGNSQITDMEIIINDPNIRKDVRPSEAGSPYTPITSASGSGDDFTITDTLYYEESHSETLQLKHTGIQSNDYIKANFSVSDLGYTDDSIIYDFSSISAIKDFYGIESYTSRSVRRDIGFSDYKIAAQGFEVEWDYANFTQARLWLQENVVFNDEVEIFLCPIGTDNYPNATNVLSTSGTYSGTGLQGTTLEDGVTILPTYTFSEVTLTKGTYFVVVNYTTFVDGANSVMWWGNNTTPNTNIAYRSLDNGPLTSWSDNTYDFTLEVELLPVDVSLQALAVTSPNIIDLKDNSTSILSNYFVNSNPFEGFHRLLSNTSVTIDFTTTYQFSTLYTGASIYSISNSTFDSMTCDWDISWTSAEISTLYTLVSRNQTLDIGADWTDAFNWLYNSTGPFPYEKLANQYIIYLGTNESAGDWLIDTNSPNHMYSVTLSDETAEAERYFLGYWTTDEVDATGYNGSEINLAAVVQSNVSSLVPEDTGAITYSIYNSTGQIVPIDPAPHANIIYNDVTSYSISGIPYASPGNWNSQIVFDPSIYGSDQPGFWTAVVLWQNGTQIGFYTQRIIVQSQTYVDYDWEISPGGGVYGTTDVTRQQNDNVDVRVWYFNISEPFLTGNGTLIPTVDVTYSTTWLTGASFVGVLSPYTASVLVNTGVGINTVTIVATGAFLENHTTSFDVTVFYQLTVNPVSQYYATNYTNNGIFFMYLYDESATTNLGTVPNDMIVTISNASVAYNLTTGVDYTFTYQGAVEETWKLDLSTSTNNLAVGNYDVFVAAQITDYRANYTKEYASDSFVLDITAPKTEIQNIGGDLSIYSYHNATISFQFVDTNHSTDILGATIGVIFSAENIIYNSYAIGNIYYINIQNNNASLSSFTVFLDVSKDNYESIASFSLRIMTVDVISTDLQIVGAPGSISIGYPFSITVNFTDIDNNENITIPGDVIYTILTNSTDYTVLSVVHWKDGLYNITILNNDYDLDWLQITIEFGKPGYLNSTDIIDIELIFVDTDADLLTSPNNTVYYDQNVVVTIRYWDINSQFNITTPDIINYTGNFTLIFNVTNILLSNSTDTFYLYINNIGVLGTFELNIEIIEFGYLPQLITIYITIGERPTIGETNEGETEVTITNDADVEEIGVYISYTDGLNSSVIYSAEIQFSNVNGTLGLYDYFDAFSFTTFDPYYLLTFDPNDAAVVGTTLVIVITIYRYGYELQTITITLIFNPAYTYDMDVEIVGEVRQLETIQFQITIENGTYYDVSALSSIGVKYIPDLALGSVNITYTFIFANGTEMTYWILVDIEEVSGEFIALTDDILIPWRVIGIKYSAEYVASNNAVVLSQASTEEEVVTESASFMALLTFLFQTYTPYMAAGLAAIAVVLLYLTIHFAVIRPKKQRKKAKKRRYLDKISKILTSVISMRKVIVVHNETGLPIYEWDLGGEISVDSSLVSGFLQAVSGMGGEISGGEAGAVRKIDYGQFCVSSAGTDCITTYLFSTGDISADVETGIASFVDWFEKKFHTLVSTTWDGKTDEFLANERSIIDTLSENLFVWTLHPLSVNAVKEKDVLKLDSFSQRLYKFIKDYNEVSISVALEFFSKQSMEDVLSKIFEMVDANILLRKRLR